MCVQGLRSTGNKDSIIKKNDSFDISLSDIVGLVAQPKLKIKDHQLVYIFDKKLTCSCLSEDSFDQQLASPKHPTHFQWGLDLENVMAIQGVEYPCCLDYSEQQVFDDMLRCRP